MASEVVLAYPEESIAGVCPREYLKLRFTLASLPDLKPSFIEDYLLDGDEFKKYPVSNEELSTYNIEYSRFNDILDSSLRDDYESLCIAFFKKTGIKIRAAGYSYEAKACAQYGDYKSARKACKLASGIETGISGKLIFISDLYLDIGASKYNPVVIGIQR